MGEWNSMQTSSKELHEAIKESLNGLIFSNSQGMNMSGRNKGKENQMASYIDEDLERALKLSLNPEEQMTKEQRDFVLACKESLVEPKDPPDDDVSPTFMKFVPNNIMEDEEEVIYLDDDIDDIYHGQLSSHPGEPGGGLSDIILSHGSKNVDKIGKKDKSSVIMENENIKSAESIKSDIESVKSNDNNVIAKLSTDSESKNNSMDNVNATISNTKKKPTKNNNKKKRKNTAAENITKHGNTNKPISLAKAAASVHEAPVLSIQQIQEEERQLQEAIEKSKQDAENAELSEPISPTFHGRSSPQVAPTKQESGPFINVLKSQETVSPSFEVAPVKQVFPGRVSTGGAGTFLEEEEKQLREALEKSKKEILLGATVLDKGANSFNKKEPSNPTKSEDTMLTDSLDYQRDVKKMSEEEQLRYALQLSSKELGSVVPNYNYHPPSNLNCLRDVSMSPPLGYKDITLKPVTQTVAQRKSSPANRMGNNTKELGKKGQRRPIVIDGCNVAYHHGRHDMFSAQGLKVMYDEFVRKGWPSTEIHIFVKPSRMTEADRELCDSMERIGVLHWTPTRRVGHQKFTSDDDDMILEYARKKGGVIVTRDQYRDSYDRCPEFKETIEKRLLQFNFINDDVIFPRDPLGKSGPSLEQFLRF